MSPLARAQTVDHRDQRDEGERHRRARADSGALDDRFGLPGQHLSGSDRRGEPPLCGPPRASARKHRQDDRHDGTGSRDWFSESTHFASRRFRASRSPLRSNFRTALRCDRADLPAKNITTEKSQVMKAAGGKISRRKHAAMNSTKEPKIKATPVARWGQGHSLAHIGREL